MYYYKVSYKLKDSKTEEEFIILLYCKSLYDKFNRSDLPRAIKDALTTEFQISSSRIETDGKGESMPVSKNDNPVGKAQNRRVEFIKM